jgi:hypothetical protein
MYAPGQEQSRHDILGITTGYPPLRFEALANLSLTQEERIMSVVVEYPVEVKRYRVCVKRNGADILLEGVEEPLQRSGDSRTRMRAVGRITFIDPKPVDDKDFINRGGFLQMDRPLAMFSGILDLLRNEKPLFLREDGTLSTSLETVGEAEDRPAYT